MRSVRNTWLAAATLCLASALSSPAISLVNLTQNDLPGYVQALDGNTVAYAPASQGDEQVFYWLENQIGASSYPMPQDEILARGSSAEGLDLSSFANEYLVVHWGNGPANQLFDKADRPSGGFNQVFRIVDDGQNNLVDLLVPWLAPSGDPSKPKSVGGLSYWRVYDPPQTPPNNVPDGGSTLFLLVSAFGLVTLAAQRMGAKKH